MQSRIKRTSGEKYLPNSIQPVDNSSNAMRFTFTAMLMGKQSNAVTVALTRMIHPQMLLVAIMLRVMASEGEIGSAGEICGLTSLGFGSIRAVMMADSK